MSHARSTNLAAFALLAFVLLMSWGFREEMRGGPPVDLVEETPVSVTWQHTPKGAAGPLTITVTQRANESDDEFDGRLARRLKQYPPDPPEEG